MTDLARTLETRHGWIVIIVIDGKEHAYIENGQPFECESDAVAAALRIPAIEGKAWGVNGPNGELHRYDNL